MAAIYTDFVVKNGIVIEGDSAVTSSTNQANALQVDGGAAVAKNLIVGTTATIFGNVLLNQPLLPLSNSATLGSPDTPFSELYLSGNSLYLGSVVLSSTGSSVTFSSTLSSTLINAGSLALSDNTSSTSSTTGALRVAGGAGVSGSVYVGNNVTVQQNLSVTGTAVVDSTLSVAGVTSVINNTLATTAGAGALKVTGGARINNNLVVMSTASNTGTLETNAIYVEGGVGIKGGLAVSGSAVFKNDVYFQGATTYVYSTNTVYTDNLIELHVPPAGSWLFDDGKDVGFRFHYYNNADWNAALIIANDSKKLEFYKNGSEVNGAFVGVYGDFKTGSIQLVSTTTSISTTTGALTVAGGVGIAGNLYVAGGITLSTINTNGIVYQNSNGVLVSQSYVTYNTTTHIISGTITQANNLNGGEKGAIPIQSNTGTTTFIAPGVGNQQILMWDSGTSSAVWSSNNNAGTANTASNIAGGYPGSIVYQSNTNSTTFLIGSGAEYMLTYNTSTHAPQWTNPNGYTVGYANTATTATWASTSSYAILASSADFATTATTSTYANIAFTSTYADIAFTATYANIAFTSTFANTSNYAIVAGTSTYANIAFTSTWANTSNYAIVAGTSTYANIAFTATYANIAFTSTWANTSNYAIVAGTSTYANIAFTSTFANTSTNILGGATGSILYQSTTGITVSLPLGNIGEVLSVGTNAPNWTGLSGITVAYANTATTSTWANTSNYAIVAGTSTYANIAFTSTFANTSNYAIVAGTSTYADIAFTATYANIAFTATYANIAFTSTFANTSNYAVVAGTSTYANIAFTSTFANTSNYAIVAGTSTYANIAFTATYANIAFTSTFANTSNYAVVAGTSTYAFTSTNISGGVAGQLVYQLDIGVTRFVNTGTAGDVLVSNGSTAPTYNNTLTLAGTNSATSTITGALQVVGGVGIGGDVYAGGEIYIKNQKVVTTATINQFANQTTITAGTDTAINTNTGAITIWNTGTFQSVSDRGNSTTNTIVINNDTSATSTITGAFQVVGGAGVGGDIYVGGAIYAATTSYIGTGTILTSIDLQTVTYQATYLTNDPTSVAGLVAVAGTSTAYGTYNFGSVTDIQTFNDYNTATNTGFYSINDASGAPGAVTYIGFTGVVDFNRFVLNINYTANSGHTQEIDIYNWITASWDTFTTYSGFQNWFQFIETVIDPDPYISSGKVWTKVYHVSTGNVAHRTWIDYAALEKSIRGGQGPRGATGATGATGPQGLTTTTTSTFTFTNSTDSTSTTTGAVVVTGGVGIGKSLFVGSTATILSTASSTATLQANALYVAGGIGASSLFVQGPATFNSNVVFNGTYTYVLSTNTVYTDNIIELHYPNTPGNVWSANDSTDIGLRFHYYDTTDCNAFFGRDNTTGYLEWLVNSSADNINNVTGTNGTFRLGSIILTNSTASSSTSTGALTVVGGVGIGGALYVSQASYIAGAQILTTATVNQYASQTTIFAGTDTAVNTSTGAVTVWNTSSLQSVTSRGATTDVAVSITNSTASSSTSTGALVVAGGVGINKGLYVGGTVTATSFVGVATTATNIANGAAGSLPYQSATGTTTFLSIGTNGYVLTSNGTGPTWSAISGLSVGNSTTATNLANGTAGQVPYQTGAGATSFYGPGTAGQILLSSGTNAPVYTNTSSIYVGKAVLADTATLANNATTATNIAGGTAGQLHYQTGPGATSFAGPGTAGNVLVSNGTSAPSYNNTLTLASTTTSVSTTTGALQVRGGVGVADSLYVGNRVGFVGTTNSSVVYQYYNTLTNSLDTVFG